MIEFYNKLDKLYEAGDIPAVEAFIKDAISENAANGRSESLESAGLYNELAAFYRGVSSYAGALEAFTRALEIFEANGMGNTPEYATVLLNLAGLRRLTGDADAAVGLFLRSMKMLEDAGRSGSYEYVSVLNNLALAYQEKGDPAQALEYAERALGFIRAGSGSEHELATSLGNLAAMRFKLSEYEAADILISEALELYDNMPDINVHHAAALTTKAAVLCRTGDYGGALSGFKQALELTRRFFGENIEFAICRRNIAEIYELLNDFRLAAEEMEDAARIFRVIHGADHPLTRDAVIKLDLLREKAHHDAPPHQNALHNGETE